MLPSIMKRAFFFQTNKKLPIKSDEECSVVAGVVLLSLRLRESMKGCYTTESLQSLRSQRSLLLLPL